MVSGWVECNGLVKFGRWVVWGGVGLVLGGTFGWFWVVLLAGLRWYLGLVWWKVRCFDGIGWFGE